MHLMHNSYTYLLFLGVKLHVFYLRLLNFCQNIRFCLQNSRCIGYHRKLHFSQYSSYPALPKLGRREKPGLSLTKFIHNIMISDENLFRCRLICSRTDSSRLIQRQQEGVPSLVPNPTPKVPGSPTYPSTLRVRLKSS